MSAAQTAKQVMPYVFQSAFVLVAIVYVVFAGTIGVKAAIDQKEGWISAVLFSLMLLSLPFWVAAMYQVFLYLQGTPLESGFNGPS